MTDTPAGQGEPVVVALDVGGTGIKCALVRQDGTALHAERHPTRAERGPTAVVDTILDVAEGLADKARADGRTPVACGIGVPGLVDETAGVAVWSSNLGFRGVPLRELARTRTGLPTALGHDVRVGGLAESRLGAGRGVGHLLFVAVGTGIAAAHIAGGSATAGAHGAAGELGHILVRPDGPRCGCGRPGCLEAVSSASAIGRRYTELTRPAVPSPGEAGASDRPGGSGTTTPRLVDVPRDGVAFSAAEVADRATAGEQLAGRVWREAVEALADGLATAQALFDVESMVIGGGLARAGARLFDPLRSALRERITFHREPRLVAAALGDEAGCLGAALLAFDSLEQPWPCG
ncbi:ROK family protein [Micromonospora sp. KC606]|uniref:ROK family protein n=1 Tax=Micromonospora sp. KC606 TaxID=2530379 RepID=UPI00104B3D48|nr:ROK family protein [Micromonospora sp. KC606]TDC77760.1 ROK family protein [Micromonospora sp. KC606]